MSDDMCETENPKHFFNDWSWIQLAHGKTKFSISQKVLSCFKLYS